MNYLKTTILLVALAALLIFIGGLIGGQNGIIIAFVFSLIINLGSFLFSDKIVLAMYKAQALPEQSYPEIYQMVKELAAKDKMPIPRIYFVPMDAPNAFATGRNPKNGVVCVTRGIINMLSKDELKGVIAHEMSHIKNRDTLIMTVTATIASTIMMLANMARWAAIFGGAGGRGSRDRDSGNVIGLIAISILAPLAAMLIQLAISRSREYAADHSGAAIVGSGLGLASALAKLDGASKRYGVAASPQTAHLFIVNPLSGNSIAGLFRTHPPTEERIKRLRMFVK